MILDTSPTVLVILDGFGYSPHTRANAVYHAHPHYLSTWWHRYPHALLCASGQAVGLPEGTIGNSEVGHMTMGSGRIIDQPLTVLNKLIDTGAFFHNDVLVKNIGLLKKHATALHLLGLVSDAGVHSNEKHLFALLELAARLNLETIWVHAILDGRDVPPRSAAVYLEHLDSVLSKLKRGKLGSVHGRFYAMDRDKHWDRTQASYRILAEPVPSRATSWHQVLEYYYAHGITDEFIPPTQLNHTAYIQDGDGLIFFNIRPDRARQLTTLLAHNRHLAWLITATEYSPVFSLDTIYTKPVITHTLLDVLQEENTRIFTIAETEKYAHITYFFSGGKETVRPHEKRVLIPSLSVRTYVDYPEMSAPKITHAVLESLKTDPYDFYLINYANADMVGHSGNFDATVKAIMCLDEQLKQLYDVVVMQLKGTLYITSDHGNAEDKWDPRAHQPRTSHTTNPVPFIMIRQDLEGTGTILPLQGLADVAPFILSQRGLRIPDEMTGHTGMPCNISYNISTVSLG